MELERLESRLRDDMKECGVRVVYARGRPNRQNQPSYTQISAPRELLEALPDSFWSLSTWDSFHRGQLFDS